MTETPRTTLRTRAAIAFLGGVQESDASSEYIDGIIEILAAIEAEAARVELREALLQVERDGLIVLLGLGNPEVRTDFTTAPDEVADAILRATEGKRQP